MSLALAALVAFGFMVFGMELNIPPEYLIITLAIIFAGGLAGCKD